VKHKPVEEEVSARPDQKIGAQERAYRGQKTGSRPAPVILAAFFLGSQILFALAGLASANSGKSDWWPTKQYSWTDVLLVLITFVYVVATAGYVVISRRQWRVLRDTLSLTANTQRAWLFVDKVDHFRPIADQESPALVRIRNTGKLPAFDVKGTARPRRGSEPFPRLRRPGVGASTFAGNESHRHVFPIAVGSAADIRDIASLSLVLTVELEITYTDPLGTQGVTKVDMTYHPGPGGDHGVLSFRNSDIR
jgi:hypothetical protein